MIAILFRCGDSFYGKCHNFLIRNSYSVCESILARLLNLLLLRLAADTKQIIGSHRWTHGPKDGQMCRPMDRQTDGRTRLSLICFGPRRCCCVTWIYFLENVVVCMSPQNQLSGRRTRLRCYKYFEDAANVD